MKEKQYDWESLHTLPLDQKIQAIQSIAKVANTRLSALEKSGQTSFAYKKASKMLKSQKPRFYRGNKYTEAQAARALYQLEEFITLPTSTITGTKKVHSRTIETLSKDRKSQFGVHLAGLTLTTENTVDFFDFLQSSQYKHLEKMVSSGDVQELWLNSYNAGLSEEEIAFEFEEFEKGVKNYDDVKRDLENLAEEKRLYGSGNTNYSRE